MNKIEISGRITKEPVFSHENHGEKFYSTQITSVRTSGVPDTLNVTFSEIFLKNIKEDEQVEIFGEIRTMNYDGHCHIFVFAKDVTEYPGKDGKVYYYAMNGQTGTINGDFPFERKKALLTSVVSALFVLIFMLVGGYFS